MWPILYVIRIEVPARASHVFTSLQMP